MIHKNGHCSGLGVNIVLYDMAGQCGVGIIEVTNILQTGYDHVFVCYIVIIVVFTLLHNML